MSCRVAKCRACQQEIVWLKTRLGKSMPVNYSGPHLLESPEFDPKKHESHFATCPQAEKFRKEKP